MKKKTMVTVGVLALLVFTFFKVQPSTTPEVFTEPFRTAVELEYRQKYRQQNQQLVEATFWENKIDGLSPKEVLAGKAKRLYAEYQLLEREAKKISSKTKTVDVVTANWQDVSDNLFANRQLIKNAWINQLQEQDICDFYEKNKERFSEHARLKGSLSFWQNGMEQWTKPLEISAENVRKVTEEYPELEMDLADMQVGQQKNWSKHGGTYNFLCLEREEGQPLPFNEVIEAVASQLVEQKLENWVNETLGKSSF